jgi:drug/metabolite transporter (DMT)-like permease
VSQRSAIDPAAGALLFVLCAIWGVGQVAIKVGNQGISPLYHAAIRSAGSALLLWGWSAWRGIALWRRDGSAGYGATIATLFAVEFVCVYWGFMYTTASRGVLFIYAARSGHDPAPHAFLPAGRLRDPPRGARR